MVNIDYEKIYTTKNYGSYKIIQRLGYINNDSRLWVKIKFLYTGYEKNIRYDYIGHDILDPYYPRIHGVACIGEVEMSRNEYKSDYDRWINMISRCYNPNDKDYPRYGGKGIKVDDRWLIFSNYLNDIKLLPGYRYKQYDQYHYQLDKDYLQQNVNDCNKLYSPSTCIWILNTINSKLATNTFNDELEYVDYNGNRKLVNMVTIINK